MWIPHVQPPVWIPHAGPFMMWIPLMGLPCGSLMQVIPRGGLQMQLSNLVSHIGKPSFCTLRHGSAVSFMCVNCDVDGSTQLGWGGGAAPSACDSYEGFLLVAQPYPHMNASVGF